jgi:hypothetical protein
MLPGGLRENSHSIKSDKKIFNPIRKIGNTRGCIPSPTMTGAASSRFKAAIITAIESIITELGKM